MNPNEIASIIRPEDQITSSWSGGTTTELFIYPFDSEFAERNFDFRLSTATVESETSTFTPLMAFNRVLMVLEGQLELIHSDQYRVTLGKFEKDRFKGAWKTESIGRCVDLNFIFRHDLAVEMTGYVTTENESIQLSFNENNWVFVYCITGTLNILFKQVVYTLAVNCLAVFKINQVEQLEISSPLGADFVIIHFNATVR